jgi:hypothetical protein
MENRRFGLFHLRITERERRSDSGVGENKYRIYDDYCECVGTGAECLRDLKIFKNK